MAQQRILVVEDNDGLRYAMCRELEAAGYAVAQAHDYRDALEILENGRRFAVLVTDLVLPGVNGFALARMARMRHHNIRAVFITGFENIPLSEATGPVLRKPLEPDVLLTTIASTLDAAKDAGSRRRAQAKD